MKSAVKLKGVIKVTPEGFLVKEVLQDGTIIRPCFTQGALPEQKSSGFSAFALTKRGIGAVPAYRELSKQLGVKQHQITAHGRKDQFAVTSQMIVVEGVYSPSFLHEKMWLSYRGATTGPLYRGLHPNGYYKGNSFSISVKTEATVPPEGKKFLNLFGPQRFGDGRIHVGRHLLEGNFKAACELILDSPMNGEQLKAIARRYNLELVDAMLHSDFQNILDFKVAQWQSYLWNTLAQKLRNCEGQYLKIWDV